MPLVAQQEIDLPEAAAHHAHRVLRLKVGDALTVFNGLGGEYPAKIVGASRHVRVLLGEQIERERESPLNITLVQGLPASDKMDWIIQKAVELGVSRIVPLAATRSVVRLSGDRALRRVEHWQSVAVSACEQCGRNRVPKIEPLFEMRSWLAQLPKAADSKSETRLLFSPEGKQRLSEFCSPAILGASANIVLLIGPEGGLTAEEELAAQTVGFQAVLLGPRILRTETAGLAALAALAALVGEF